MPSRRRPARSAVQLTLAPVARDSAANSSNIKPGPMVACSTPRLASPSAPASAWISAKAAARLGTGRPPKPTWVSAFEVAKPSAPASSPSRTRARMRATAAPLDGVEISRKALEAPVAAHTGLERGDAHALDLFQRARDEAAMRGMGRCDAEAAIAHDDRRDAVPGRDAEEPVPQDLRVVMGVDVDEAGGDDAARRVNGLACLARGIAQCHDLAAADADIAGIARLAGAVDDGAAADLEVERHGSTLLRSGE